MVVDGSSTGQELVFAALRQALEDFDRAVELRLDRFADPERRPLDGRRLSIYRRKERKILSIRHIF
jgi:hypothetical protein